MKPLSVILLVLACSVASGQEYLKDYGAMVENYGDRTWDAGTYFVMVTAEWCQPCQDLKRELVARKVTVYLSDIDKRPKTSKELLGKRQVLLPTLIRFDIDQAGNGTKRYWEVSKQTLDEFLKPDARREPETFDSGRIGNLIELRVGEIVAGQSRVMRSLTDVLSGNRSLVKSVAEAVKGLQGLGVRISENRGYLRDIQGRLDVLPKLREMIENMTRDRETLLESITELRQERKGLLDKIREMREEVGAWDSRWQARFELREKRMVERFERQAKRQEFLQERVNKIGSRIGRLFWAAWGLIAVLIIVAGVVVYFYLKGNGDITKLITLVTGLKN